MDIERWNFRHSENGERLERLEQSSSFESIVEGIRDHMTILCCHQDSIQGTLFKRVVYCVKVSGDLFDLFFNSRSGYRAWYYRSPFEGLRANSLAIGLLCPIMVMANQTQESNPGTDFIRESLTSPSSKIWLAECGREICLTCHGCRGEWSAGASVNHNEIEILNNRWELSSDLKARWGRRAPYLTKLKVFGAFIDNSKNEFIPSIKRFRAHEISEFGWS
jgi:hypothetical protein